MFVFIEPLAIGLRAIFHSHVQLAAIMIRLHRMASSIQLTRSSAGCSIDRCCEKRKACRFTSDPF